MKSERCLKVCSTICQRQRQRICSHTFAYICVCVRACVSVCLCACVLAWHAHNWQHPIWHLVAQLSSSMRRFRVAANTPVGAACQIALCASDELPRGLPHCLPCLCIVYTLLPEGICTVAPYTLYTYVYICIFLKILWASKIFFKNIMQDM